MRSGFFSVTKGRSTMARLVPVAIVSVVLAAAFLCLTGRSGLPPEAVMASLHEEGGAIFFLRSSSGKGAQLCRYDVATGKVHIVTREGFSRFSPSPDATQVAFVREDSVKRQDSPYSFGVPNVYVLDTPSGKIRNLTEGLVETDGAGQWEEKGYIVRREVQHVAWSPDGKYIAFSRYITCSPSLVTRQEGLSAPETWAVHVVEPDGSNTRELAKWPPIPWDVLPASFGEAERVKPFVQTLSWWGPDSRTLRITVRFMAEGGPESSYEFRSLSYLAELDEDGLSVRWSGPTTESEEVGGLPSYMLRSKVWSPDGKRLAYTVCSGKASPMAVDALYVVDADGVSNNTLAYKGGQETIIHHFGWSPSGRYLILELWGADGYTGLYVVSVDGGKPVAITRGGWGTIDVNPTWVACPPLPDSR